MASGIQKRKRSERVAALELPPGAFERAILYCKRGDVLLRLGLCVLTVLALWCVTLSWSVPLEFQRGYVPPRNIVAKVPFQEFDPEKTRDAEMIAANKVSFVYDHDTDKLVQLRAALQNRAIELGGAKTLADLAPSVWDEFFPPPGSDAPVLTPEEKEQRFQLLRGSLSTPESLAKLDQAVAEVLEPYERRGLLDKLPQEPNEGNQQEIVVIPKGKPSQRQVVKVADVLIGDADWLKKGLAERLDSPELATRVFTWLQSRLPTTLKRNETEIRLAQQRAEEAVPREYRKILPGDVLAPAGKQLEDLSTLELEHQAYLAHRTVRQKIAYSFASLGMFLALSILCGVYVLHYEPKLIENLKLFATTLATIVVTVGIATIASRDNFRAELLPIVVFGMTFSIAFHREFALLFSAVVTVIVVVATGQGLGQFMILYAAAASAILLVGGVRNRRKLIYVGLAVGVVATLTTIGVETLAAQPFAAVWPDALYNGLFAVFAGVLMLGLLPFIESLFGVQTELSLLELGDVAHPLLQELVRRAPGTYNHSINVASIAEAAAESIGAKGLLVRVGAYFHDIGKMLKPGYFVENQGHDANRHESLVPAMSTLIIIAHIKDGADLARQHRLPKPIIDFIEQHHGTTLVEYFFRRAAEANGGTEVDESNFRYPGPKPQTKEAAVLMLADAVEGACRTLVEPTPARIESLVHDIAMKRLLDGQFDACGLTLQELATIEDSLVKSLTAVYHGRVKYPDQRTA
jgi:putative nucleotidyltransferase with HDIG domain